MPKTKQQKYDAVSVLSDKLSRSRSVVLADYQGLTMAQLTEIRQKLLDLDSEFTVTKNNLLKISLKNSGYVVDDSTLTGATATLMAFDDEISPIKTLTKAIKEFQMGSIKIGYLNKDLLTQQQVQKLADLPSKDELRAKLVGSLGYPLYGIVNVMQANIRNLVYVLDQVRSSKGGE